MKVAIYQDNGEPWDEFSRPRNPGLGWTDSDGDRVAGDIRRALVALELACRADPYWHEAPE